MNQIFGPGSRVRNECGECWELSLW